MGEGGQDGFLPHPSPSGEGSLGMLEQRWLGMGAQERENGGQELLFTQGQVPVLGQVHAMCYVLGVMSLFSGEDRVYQRLEWPAVDVTAARTRPWVS